MSRLERGLQSWYRRLVGAEFPSERRSETSRSERQRTQEGETIQARVVNAGDDLTFLRVPADADVASLENGRTVTVTVYDS